MSLLNDLVASSPEANRIELAKLFAAGLLRLMLQRASISRDDGKESRQISPDGLADS
jgi:hypothetical protein